MSSGSSLLLVSYSNTSWWCTGVPLRAGKRRQLPPTTTSSWCLVFIPSIYLYAWLFISFSMGKTVSISHTVKNHTCLPMIGHPDEPGDAGSTQKTTLTSVGLYKAMTVGRSLWPCFPLVRWRESFCVCRVISPGWVVTVLRSKCTVNLSNIFRFFRKMDSILIFVSNGCLNTPIMIECVVTETFWKVPPSLSAFLVDCFFLGWQHFPRRAVLFFVFWPLYLVPHLGVSLGCWNCPALWGS